MVHVSPRPPYDPGRSAFPSPVLASALHAIFQRQPFLFPVKLKALASIPPTMAQFCCPLVPTPLEGFPAVWASHHKERCSDGVVAPHGAIPSLVLLSGWGLIGPTGGSRGRGRCP